MRAGRSIAQGAERFISAAILLGVIFTSQYLQNAYFTELQSDATGHYLTTLLAYDYIKAGFPGNPVAYAVEYFVHYPLIRIGNNPPFFYALTSLWAFVTTDTIHSALFLSAILGAIYCLLVFYCSVQILGPRAGLIIALLVAVLPTFQAGTGSFLIDIPVGIFSLAAALYYSAFLNEKSAKPAIWFSAFAAAALMIKLSALFLALMVPLALLISGKFPLLRHKYFWLPAVMVGVLIMPWYFFTFESLTAGVKTQWTILYPLKALAGYLAILARNLTLPGIVVLLIGIIERVRFIRANPEDKTSNHWTVIIALFVAVLLFQALMPTNILQRYLTTALGPAVILAWQGARVAGGALSEALRRHTIIPESFRRAIPNMAVAALLLAILASALPIEPLTGNQMAGAAQIAYENLPAKNPVVLIASDGDREVSFIAQMAQLDRSRPNTITIRGGRLLGQEQGFMDIDYKPKFASPVEVLAELERFSIAMIVLDTGRKALAWQHNKDIAWLVGNKPDLWRQIGSMDNPGGDGAISLYILKDSEPKAVNMPLFLDAFRPRAGSFGKRNS